MTKKAFKIEGDFQMGRMRQPFAVEMIGSGEDDAKQHAYKDIGSRHGTKRRDITITSVTPVEAENATEISRKRIEKSS